jgi:hypothetical protein
VIDLVECFWTAGQEAHMARVLVLPLFFGIALAGTLMAQNNPAPSVPESRYVGSFFAVGTNGELTELDHQTVTTFHSKSKVLPGYATVKVLAEIKPGHALLRLPGNAQFVIRGRSLVDPLSLYELRALKVSKDHREILMTQGHGTIVGGTATSKLDEGEVPIRFDEYGASSYRITPLQPLPRGEYALALRGSVTELYCFGVDR